MFQRWFRVLGVAAVMACFSSQCLAQVPYFELKDLLAHRKAKSVMRDSVKLYWGDAALPGFAEESKARVFTGKNIERPGLFSLSPRNSYCESAFFDVLEGMIDEAEERGFDHIFDIRVQPEVGLKADDKGFECQPGAVVTLLKLRARFGASPELQARQLAAEKVFVASKSKPRSAAKKAIFLPLSLVMESVEMREILGQDIQLFWGDEPSPAYYYRFGPDDHSEDGDVKKLGPEEACRQGALMALREMANDARRMGYSQMVQMRSFLNEAFPPASTDFECEVGSSDAEVSFRGFFTSPK